MCAGTPRPPGRRQIAFPDSIWEFVDSLVVAPMPELSNQFFTPEEVAALLGVPQERVELWIKCRTLQTVEGPSGRRIRRVELVPFVRPLLHPDELVGGNHVTAGTGTR
jgi:hypothetical protein